MLFELGMTRVTPDAQRAIEESAQKPIEFLLRHGNADWGDIEDEEDTLSNLCAIETEGRILSIYHTTAGVKLYVITDAGKRVTTILLPHEY